jgi:hypothetical protein
MFSEGTVSQRLCTLAEVKLYFDNIHNLDNPEPNLNCNSSSWNSACEAGWAAQTLTPEGLDSDIVPVRTLFRRTCCDGFFCPRGLTCMMRKHFASGTQLGLFTFDSTGTQENGFQLTLGILYFDFRSPHKSLSGLS